ncbi:DUF368 domain-containing protein [Dolosigranulum pigrum]|uniref:DUF368 domain-containing protein n=2 Tax=Dolosigranulum pigrum TaxID=29394 RepID=UPI000DC016E7|nr:DUF368 domain-containing protein [Dolosigranulum pigrum]RAN54450.1 DUF368 domain-containing protein [Dolosigranulum pigrum]VTU67307.1 hypothetical protein [Lactobacillus backii] [Dolosigranulum pigrum]
MTTVLLIIKGMFIGVANIIPGVSGGTMAVSLGIYDDLIASITHLVKEWKKSIQFLTPIVVGAAAGVILFSYLITLLLTQYTLPTALTFVGLILGGVPILFHSFRHALREKNESIRAQHWLVFCLFFAIIVVMSLVQESGDTLSAIEVSGMNMVVMLLIGMIASATMVIPGISGSLVLMIIGYYYGLINTLRSFFEAVRHVDMANIMNGLVLLVPFGIGVLLGGALISKLIEYLFHHYASLTYSAILGLVIASPIAIILNTTALNDLSRPSAMLLLLSGLILGILAFFMTYYLGQAETSSDL